MDYKVIVFGQHNLNTLGQIRSFGEIGIKPIVIWVSHDDHSPKGNKYIREFHNFNSFEEGLDYIITNYNKNKYFISTDSDSIIALLDQNYNKLKEHFYFFNAGEQGRLTSFMPKLTQCQLLKKHGFNIPKTELVSVGDLPKDLKYPIFTKAIDSLDFGWKKNSFICNNDKELLKAYKSMNAKKILLQEFIKKDNEIAFEGISMNGGEEIFLPIQGEYLRIEDGAFGTYKKNELFHEDEDFKIKIQKVFKEINYSGVFEIEFIRDLSGKLFFLEINFRHTQYNHALTNMGVNFCKLWIDSINFKTLIGHKFQYIKTPSLVMHEIKDFRASVLTKKISFFDWIKDFIKCDSYYIIDKKDFSFTILYFLFSIKNFLKYKLRNHSISKHITTNN